MTLVGFSQTSVFSWRCCHAGPVSAPCQSRSSHTSLYNHITFLFLFLLEPFSWTRAWCWFEQTLCQKERKPSCEVCYFKLLDVSYISERSINCESVFLYFFHVYEDVSRNYLVWSFSLCYSYKSFLYFDTEFMLITRVTLVIWGLVGKGFTYMKYSLIWSWWVFWMLLLFLARKTAFKLKLCLPLYCNCNFCGCFVWD